ncbi:MAG: hypothetical protein ACRDE2_14890 [Chitinophagaceae bacterium]
MKKLVIIAVACIFASTAAFAQVQQPQQTPQQGTFQQPQQKQQSTYFPQQHNESTFPENQQQKTFPQHKNSPVMSRDNLYQTVRSDTTHPRKEDTSAVDTTNKVDTSDVKSPF